MYTCEYICIYTCLYMYTTNIKLCVYIYVYIHTYIQPCKYMYIYIHMCACNCCMRTYKRIPIATTTMHRACKKGLPFFHIVLHHGMIPRRSKYPIFEVSDPKWFLERETVTIAYLDPPVIGPVAVFNIILSHPNEQLLQKYLRGCISKPPAVVRCRIRLRS